jgi:site-specific DNA-methyltransferase (adenine-specific)
MSTPYYSDENVTIYHGDCREIMPGLDRPDMILTDPPYGLGDLWAGGGGEFTKSSWKFDPREAMSWDQTTADEVVASLVGLADTVVIWGGNYYALPASRCWFLWDKKQNDKWTTAQAEMAWTNVDRPVRTFRMSQVVAHSQMDKKHPTQKPESLMSWCIEMTRANPTTILDPFMGSGTSLVVAKARGIKAIGIELDEKYCEIAAKRMAQGVLDFGAAA